VQNLDTVPKNLSGFESLNSNIKLKIDRKLLSKITNNFKKEQGNESQHHDVARKMATEMF